MNEKVLLNGEEVDVSLIDPSKHKFIGTFRPPNPPKETFVDDKGKTQHAAVIFCPCGGQLWTYQQSLDHWQLGHFDIPQYVTI